MEAIQKLQFVQEVFEKLGLDFSNLTISDCFRLFDLLQYECKSIESESNVNKQSKIVNNF